MKPIILVSLGLLSSCTAITTTQQLLDTDFTNGLDRNPPTIITPVNKGIALNGAATISWTARLGAKSYLLQVAESPDFTKQVSGSPFSVSAPTTTLEIKFNKSITYYLRVRSNLMVSDQYGATSQVDALSDTVYVYCSDSATCGDSTVYQSGSLTHPYTRINDGVTNAKAAGIPYVKVATRQTLTYDESINMADGIRLMGAYSSDFLSRSTSTNLTKVRSTGVSALIANQITSASVIEGFQLDVTGTTANYTLLIIASNSNLTVQRNKILGNNYAGAVSIAVGLLGAGATTGTGPIVEANNILGGSGQASYGIYLETSSPIIRNNIIESGTASVIDSDGISCSAGQPTISNNSIIANNAASKTVGIYAVGSCAPVVVNNIIFSRAGTNRYGYYEGDTSGDPLSFQNNVIFDMPTALYRDGDGICSGSASNNCLTIGNMETDLNAEARPASGNITIANLATMAFVNSSSDYHLTGTTPTAVRQGGANATLSNCGLTGTTFCGGILSDYDSAARPGSDGIWALGAFEY